jgi:hypothetical protein
MQGRMRSGAFLTLALTGLAFTGCGVAIANPIPPGYQDFPVAPSEFVSQVSTPRIADDFEPAYGGGVGLIEWWGSLSAGPWQITLYSNANPDPTTPDDGGASVIVEPFDVGAWSDDIFYYATYVSGAGWRMASHHSYWLSVASLEPGWTWAVGDGQPESGSQRQLAVESLTADAWASLDPPAQLAFSVWPTGVPEPGTLVLMMIGVLGISLSRRRMIH